MNTSGFRAAEVTKGKTELSPSATFPKVKLKQKQKGRSLLQLAVTTSYANSRKTTRDDGVGSDGPPRHPPLNPGMVKNLSFPSDLCHARLRTPGQGHVVVEHPAEGRRHSNSADSGTGSLEDLTSASYAGYHFHLSEFQTDDTDSNKILRFVGKRDITQASRSEDSDILGPTGTVRGVKNRVRSGVITFNNPQHCIGHNEEIGKIVVYTTSIKIIRVVSEMCQTVRRILQNMLLIFEERDLFLNVDYQNEVLERMDSDVITLPQVFVGGVYLGGAEQVELMNEAGELRRVLKDFPKHSVTSMTNCCVCGGVRFIPCRTCSGSKKSLLRNNFTDQFIALRCTDCDTSGLQKCPRCHQPPQ